MQLSRVYFYIDSLYLYKRIYISLPLFLLLLLTSAGHRAGRVPPEGKIWASAVLSPVLLLLLGLLFAASRFVCWKPIDLHQRRAKLFFFLSFASQRCALVAHRLLSFSLPLLLFFFFCLSCTRFISTGRTDGRSVSRSVQPRREERLGMINRQSRPCDIASPGFPDLLLLCVVVAPLCFCRRHRHCCCCSTRYTLSISRQH